MEHVLPVQAQLAERSSQPTEAHGLCAARCSGKRCKSDGLVKRETHGRLCMTSAPCYPMLLPGLSCKNLSRGKAVCRVCVWL